MHDELTFSLVLLALSARALNLRNELLSIDDLIDFKAAHITSIDCNLDAWLDITYSGDNTFDID